MLHLTDLAEDETVDVLISNLSGQAVLAETYNAGFFGEIQEQISIGHLPKGIYILTAITAGGNITSKIVLF
ncbi:MAG: T9SS type A sorting domain-containing protein [Flavobacteriales bacterium]|nr:T9SS type A sorting domain-containing protein [Flavobacteriales bacterium]